MVPAVGVSVIQGSLPASAFQVSVAVPALPIFTVWVACCPCESEPKSRVVESTVIIGCALPVAGSTLSITWMLELPPLECSCIAPVKLPTSSAVASALA